MIELESICHLYLKMETLCIQSMIEFWMLMMGKASACSVMALKNDLIASKCPHSDFLILTDPALTWNALATSSTTMEKKYPLTN